MWKLTYYIKYSPLLSTMFCHFLDKAIMSSVKNLCGFTVEKLYQRLASFDTDLFPLKKFYRDQDKWTSDSQEILHLGYTVNASKFSKRAVALYGGSSKDVVGRHFSIIQFLPFFSIS